MELTALASVVADGNDKAHRNSARQTGMWNPITLAVIDNYSSMQMSIQRLCVQTMPTVASVAVEWVPFLLHNRSLTGVHPSLEIGYPDWEFSCFFAVPPGKFRASKPRRLPSSLTFVFPLIILPFNPIGV
jgi:hypothetical protein